MEQKTLFTHFHNGNELVATLALDNKDGRIVAGLAVPVKTHRSQKSGYMVSEPVVSKARGRQIAEGRAHKHGDAVEVPNRRAMVVREENGCIVIQQSTLKALVNTAIEAYKAKHLARTNVHLLTPKVVNAKSSPVDAGRAQ